MLYLSEYQNIRAKGGNQWGKGVMLKNVNVLNNACIIQIISLLLLNINEQTNIMTTSDKKALEFSKRMGVQPGSIISIDKHGDCHLTDSSMLSSDIDKGFLVKVYRVDSLGNLFRTF